MSNTYQSNLQAVVDWHKFIEDTADEFNVPLETMHKIALCFLVMHQRMEKTA